MADHRQAVVGEYSALFEDLSARVNDSVKSAWKIFGRVVARQSLLQLSADFDDLRRGFTTLASADDAQTPDMVLLVQALAGRPMVCGHARRCRAVDLHARIAAAVEQAGARPYR